jgi:DNA polymerase III delta prime subunit
VARRVEPRELYRPCRAAALPFATTAELEDAPGPLGQERALQALRLGVSIRREGYHVFALGPPGVGKRSTVRRLLEEQAAREPPAPDWAYVHSFKDPHRPRALKLPAGAGSGLARDMSRFVDELRLALPAALQSENYRARKKLLEDELKGRQEQALSEIEKRAAERRIALIRTPLGLALAPLRDGEVIEPEEFERLKEEERERFRADLADLQQRLRAAVASLPRSEKEHREKVRELDREVAAFAVAHLLDELRARYAGLPDVLDYLQSVQEDVLENADDFLPRPEPEELPPFLRGLAREDRHTHKYRVNVIVDHSPDAGAPVVEEDVPSSQPPRLRRAPGRARDPGHRLPPGEGGRAAPGRRRLPAPRRPQGPAPAVRLGGAQAGPALQAAADRVSGPGPGPREHDLPRARADPARREGRAHRRPIPLLPAGFPGPRVPGALQGGGGLRRRARAHPGGGGRLRSLPRHPGP